MANLLYPLSVKMRAEASKRVRFGYPWVFANEIEMTPEAKAIPSGSMVRLIDDNGAFLGVGSFNPHSLICFRKFSTEADIPINSAFIAKRLRKCLDLRHKLIGSTYYRLVHSEGDNLPGVVIDRFGDVVSCQLNTAGADLLRKDIVAALKEVLDPKTILFRSESSARALEGLEPLNEIEFGEIPSPLEVKENGIKFLIDIREGQKTGWFYDQRDNRAFAGRLAHGLRFADFYTYAGGFALHAAIAGAKEVLACDRSADSLALAEQSAALNKVADKSRFVKGETFTLLEDMIADKDKFDVVICDPPAFAKVKKDLNQGLKGYRKLAKLSSKLVEKGGFLGLASCSHHVSPEAFLTECSRGISESGRNGRIVKIAGAAPDHPVHPLLPETGYLKMIFFQLD